ncbi:MAG: DUF3014 domain-containing protein [Pseudomonadota bacterium]
MQADRDDRISDSDERSHNGTQTIITALAALVLAVGAYFLMPGDAEDTSQEPPFVETPVTTVEPVQAPTPEPEAAIQAAPDIPTTEAEPLEEAPQELVEEVAPPPTPEELDAEFRDALSDANIEAQGPLRIAAAAPYLLDRFVSSLDQLARGIVPGRTSNIERPAGTFPTTQSGVNYAVDPQGYRRYDSLVSAVIKFEPSKLAEFFRRNRTRLEDAYAALGYPRDAMDNTLIAALDQVIAAPISDTPPELKSKGALWAYADEGLESRSDLQKQLLRAGPENTRKLQSWAKELRTALLST